MVLKIGSTDTESVKSVQEKLGLNPDGDFGQKTKAAVEEFQKTNGLTVDGEVGPMTAKKMGLDFGFLITIQHLREITGINNFNQLVDLVKNINSVLTKYDINTKLRVSHFLGQIMHESNNLNVTKENLNYSAKGLLKTFSKYFKTQAEADSFANQPDKIANKVYANRMGNGSPESGDGAKFKGRGYIQLTGKESYQKISKDLGVDFIKEPILLETPKYAILSAGWFWNLNQLNKLADKDDINGITKKINGGFNGLEDRVEKVKKVKRIVE